MLVTDHGRGIPTDQLDRVFDKFHRVEDPLRMTTSGTVTVTDTLPLGFTLVSMAGTGWTCPDNTCTRTDGLAGGASYPPITVTVNDGQSANNTVTRSFVVTVNPVNDPPTLNSLANLSINENAAQQTVNLSGIGSGAANESQTLTVTAVSSDTTLIPTPAVTYSSPAATGSLKFTAKSSVSSTL